MKLSFFIMFFAAALSLSVWHHPVSFGIADVAMMSLFGYSLYWAMKPRSSASQQSSASGQSSNQSFLFRLGKRFNRLAK